MAQDVDLGLWCVADEYFLQNVEVIDGLTDERRIRLVSAVDWPTQSAIQSSVTVWPCYNVLAELRPPNMRLCDACVHNKVHARIILYGQPYNATTLDALAPDCQPKDQKVCPNPLIDFNHS